MRVTPALAGFREIIRRHTGDHFQAALGVKLEPLAIGPHLRTVVGDEYGNITKQQHTVFIGVVTQVKPLPEKQELFELYLFYRTGESPARFFQCSGVAITQRDRPVEPGHAIELVAQRLVEREIIEPVGMLFNKGCQCGAQLIIRVAQKAVMRGRQAHLALRRDILFRIEAGIIQPARFDQALQTDQPGVPGMYGKALVGRQVTVGRAQRQHLPQPDLAVRKKVYKPVSLDTKLTITDTAWQRCRM